MTHARDHAQEATAAADTRRGAARLRRSPERLFVSLLLALLVCGLTLSGALEPLDRQLYDAALRTLERGPPEDVVIVAIDERALAARATDAGQRWPWPRAVHAELLERLRLGGARAVLIDILFTEPDQVAPDNDRQFAAAMAAHGRVVLPLHLAALPGRGLDGKGTVRLSAVFPTPTLAPYAAAIGHTHSAFDDDGILREAALAVGAGEQRIPHAAAALLELLEPGTLNALPGLRFDAAAGGTGWFRDYRVLVPFAGPPGHFRHIGYASVLEMDTATLARQFKDTVVMVGATAPGMDLIPTPVSGEEPMPGVEVNANLFAALRDGITVLPVPRAWQLVFGMLLVVVPYLLFARAQSGWVLPMAIGWGLGTVLLSLVVLRTAALWFAPAAALTTLLAAYLVWSFQRLGTAVRFLRLELKRLDSENRSLSPPPSLAFGELADHAALLARLEGLALFAADGRRLLAWGEAPGAALGRLDAGHRWTYLDASWCRRIRQVDGDRILCAVTGSATLEPAVAGVLDAIAQRLGEPPRAPAAGAVERLEQRIEQVRNASDALSSMRRFIADSLENMADGVLVTDPLGQVQQANGNAVRFLGYGGERTPLGAPIRGLLEALELEDPASLQPALAAVQMRAAHAHLYARGPGGHDLLVQMTAHGATAGAPYPLIVSLADISALRASERRRAEMLSFISHDLRSPLISTLALTQIAALKPERLQDGKTVQRIESNVKKTLELADDFLHLARAETNEPLAVSSMDLTEAAMAAVDQVRGQAEARMTGVHVTCPSEPVTIRGERGLIERMVLNLLTNAVKYSPERARVDLRLDVTPPHAVLTVSDTGFGIPADAQAHLFDRFTRVDDPSHRAESGAGLGLAFVETVIQRHRGSIEVASAVNEGSVFTVRLPLAEAEPASGDPENDGVADVGAPQPAALRS